jgi:LmbE family N-acetylglucosaminyl deacetylase
VNAVSSLPAEIRPVIYCIPSIKNREEVLGPPDVIMDISEVTEIKKQTIAAHQSQVGGLAIMRNQQSPEMKACMQRGLKEELFWIYKL